MLLLLLPLPLLLFMLLLNISVFNSAHVASLSDSGVSRATGVVSRGHCEEASEERENIHKIKSIRNEFACGGGLAFCLFAMPTLNDEKLIVDRNLLIVLLL